MVLVVTACLLGLATVLAALAHDARRFAPDPAADESNALEPAQIEPVEFPLTWPGYDPAAVERHLKGVRRAYADLLALVPPEAEAADRARRLTAPAAGPEPRPEAAPAVPTAAATAHETDDGPSPGQRAGEGSHQAFSPVTPPGPPASVIEGTDASVVAEALRTRAAVELIASLGAEAAGGRPSARGTSGPEA